jgi:ATP-dependent RNA helicase DeaD
MSLPQTVVPALAKALAKRGYDTLTPVQEAVLAPKLQHNDLIVSAQTGSGKTVAFGLALAAKLLGDSERLSQPGDPQALVIAPTRELAMQVKGELEWLYAPAGGVVASCVGGMDSRDERRALERGAHIVVGTPGRLVDHQRRGALVLDALTSVVLDEADEMLNLGFREELEHLLEASPAERRTLMFSATMPRAIEALAKTYQRDAVRVNTVAEHKQHLDIEYRALVAPGQESENAIFNVLRYYDATNALVFCSTRMAVTHLTSRFTNRGFSVVALSGELTQSQRTHALQALRDRRANVCVATDVAARGIDLPDLDLVIHADLPKNPENLLHRSGRTGRAGRKGTSVLIVPYSARRRTERLLRDARIEAKWGEPPSVDDIRRRDDSRLIGDTLLSDPIRDEEQAIVHAVLDRHSPEAVAAAFVRLYRKGQPAPEELAPAVEAFDRQDAGARRAMQNQFENSVWITLSVGRNKQAEPRWLIPMLCKAGGLSKRDIGAIRVQQHETHVEIDAARADSFFATIGDGRLEKGVHARRMDESQPPEREPRRPSKPPPREHRKGPKQHAEATPRDKPNGKKRFDKKGPPPGAHKKRKWDPANN